MTEKALILLDADVVIHLLHADKISLLDTLYKGRLRMLDVVLDELRNNRSVSGFIDNLFTFKHVVEITFPTTSSVVMFQEYLRLKNEIRGKGERATLIYCKHSQNIIASSNTRDIVPFCQQHSLPYLTTLDILSIAVHRNILAKPDANICIKKILEKGSFLQCASIEEYIEKHFDPLKMKF